MSIIAIKSRHMKELEQRSGGEGVQEIVQDCGRTNKKVGQRREGVGWEPGRNGIDGESSQAPGTMVQEGDL